MAENKDCDYAGKGTNPANSAGTLCWIEIPTVSHTAASTFYASLFGWKTPSPTPDPPVPGTESYGVVGNHIFTDGKSINGAFVVVDPASNKTRIGDPSLMEKAGKLGPMMYFSVGKEEEGGLQGKLDLVEKLGGKTVVGKTEIGKGMGCFAQFIDLDGNVIGLWGMN